MALRRGTAPLPAPPFADPPRRVMAGLLGVVALSAVDGTILATAMPRVAATLGGLDLYAWVFAAFMLANTAATPLFGRLADRRGVKPALWLGLALVLLGSLLAGLAGSMGQLVASRALQGAGVGGLVTAASAAFSLLCMPERRAWAQGLVSVVWGVASLAGPIAGGLIVSHLPWPWVFWMNLPLGIAAALLVGRDLPAPPPRPAPHDPTIRFLPLRRNPVFLATLVLGFGACATVYPAITFVPLYLQGGLGQGAAEAGAALTPMLVAWPLASALAGIPMNRVGFRLPLVAGTALMAGGFVALALPTAAEALRAAAGAMLVGAGMGLVAATTLVASQTSVPQHRLGAASAALGVARNLGGAVGLLLMGELQLRALHAGLAASGAALAPGQAARLDEPHTAFVCAGHPGLLDPVEEAFRAALGASLREVFALSAFVALALVAFAWRMPAVTPVEAARRGTQPL